MQIAREEPFGSLQKEADTFCLKFTLNSLILSWIKMRHFLGFINRVRMIADISEKCMKISWKILIGRSSIMCLKIHWNVLLIKIRKPKPPPNYEGKQDESITHAKIQSGWKMAWLLPAKLRRSWAFWAIVMEKTIRHTWQLQLELLHFQFRDRMRDFSECGWWHDTLEKSLPSWT